MTTTASTAYAWREVERSSAKWWVLLITGIAWIIVGVLVLDADLDSAVTIGYLVGGYLIAAGVMEFVLVGVAEGWKWLHVVLGVLFVVGGIFAFTEPFQTFAVLACAARVLPRPQRNVRLRHRPRHPSRSRTCGGCC